MINKKPIYTLKASKGFLTEFHERIPELKLQKVKAKLEKQGFEVEII